MKWMLIFENHATYLVTVAALAAGIAASYGRELEAQRRPDRHWWCRRLLIVPLLVITATAATELFALTPPGAAFAAAMLSLGGYDAIRLIEARWRNRVAGAASPSASPPPDRDNHGL